MGLYICALRKRSSIQYMADPERIAATQKSIREEVDCRLNDVPCKVDEEDEETCFVNSASSTEWTCGL